MQKPGIWSIWLLLIFILNWNQSIHSALSKYKVLLHTDSILWSWLTEVSLMISWCVMVRTKHMHSSRSPKKLWFVPLKDSQHCCVQHFSSKSLLGLKLCTSPDRKGGFHQCCESLIRLCYLSNLGILNESPFFKGYLHVKNKFWTKTWLKKNVVREKRVWFLCSRGEGKQLILLALCCSIKASSWCNK